jgi:hypothetical protein
VKWWPFRPGTPPAPAPEISPAERLLSRNGFEREAAVWDAQRRGDGAALPLLLARANDWVPQVREASRRAIRSFLQERFLPDWCAALDAVLALERAGRADHRPLLSEIRDYLGRPECLPSVVAAVQGGSEQVRRFVLDIQWNSAGEEGRLVLMRRALAGSDRLVARVALGLVERIQEPGDRLCLAELGCRSRFAPVRAQSLRLVIASDAADKTGKALLHCLDRSAAVRFIAWQHVRETPFAGEALRQAKDRFRTATKVDDQCAALDFLTTAAPADTLDLCRQALCSPRPRVRAVALAALLSRSTSSVQEELLLDGLKDPSGRVQAVAVQAVLRGASPPAGDVVIAIAQTHGSVAALRRSFTVVSKTSPWERLLYLLMAAEAKLPPGGAELCVNALTEWQRDSYRNFLPLQKAQRTRVEALWRRVAPALPPFLRAQIGVHLS